MNLEGVSDLDLFNEIERRHGLLTYNPKTDRLVDITSDPVLPKSTARKWWEIFFKPDYGFALMVGIFFLGEQSGKHGWSWWVLCLAVVALLAVELVINQVSLALVERSEDREAGRRFTAGLRKEDDWL